MNLKHAGKESFFKIKWGSSVWSSEQHSVISLVWAQVQCNQKKKKRQGNLMQLIWKFNSLVDRKFNLSVSFIFGEAFSSSPGGTNVLERLCNFEQFLHTRSGLVGTVCSRCRQKGCAFLWVIKNNNADYKITFRLSSCKSNFKHSVIDTLLWENHLCVHEF